MTMNGGLPPRGQRTSGAPPRKQPAPAPAPLRGPSGSAPGSVPRGTVLRTPPGLGRIALDQLVRGDERMRDRATILFMRTHDLVFVPQIVAHASPDEIAAAEEVHRCIGWGRFKISKSQLDRVADYLTATGGPWSLRVSTVGDEFADRKRLQHWVERELNSRACPVVSTAADARILWIFCIDSAFYICHLLGTSPEPAFRRVHSAARAAALPEAVAAALVHVAQLQAGQRVLDPMCGTATIANEVLHRWPEAMTIASDTSRDLGRFWDAPAGPGQPHFLRADASRLPFRDSCIDRIICNLPWNVTYELSRETRARILEEMVRVSKPGARIVLLDHASARLSDAVRATLGLRLESSSLIQVRGMPAHLVVATC